MPFEPIYINQIYYIFERKRFLSERFLIHEQLGLVLEWLVIFDRHLSICITTDSSCNSHPVDLFWSIFETRITQTMNYLRWNLSLNKRQFVRKNNPFVTTVQKCILETEEKSLYNIVNFIILMIVLRYSDGVKCLGKKSILLSKLN
jgi:hypothetical protein